MKKYSYLTVAVLLLCGSIFTLSSCGPDEPSAAKKTLKALMGTWNISSVMVDGVDRTDIYTGMTFTVVQPNSFSVVNGGPVWDLSTSGGTYPLSFTDNSAKAFRLPSQTVVNIVSVDASNLVLSLDWDKDTFGAGRTSSVSGAHTFSFTK